MIYPAEKIILGRRSTDNMRPHTMLDDADCEMNFSVILDVLPFRSIRSDDLLNTITHTD